MMMRAAFEEWLRNQSMNAVRAADGLGYVDRDVQRQWLVWQACWSLAVSQTVDSTRCWIPRALMERIRLTLTFYGTPASYRRSAEGGLFTRLLRRSRPPPEELVRPAQELLREIEIGEHLRQ